ESVLSIPAPAGTPPLTLEERLQPTEQGGLWLFRRWQWLWQEHAQRGRDVRVDPLLAPLEITQRSDLDEVDNDAVSELCVIVGLLDSRCIIHILLARLAEAHYVVVAFTRNRIERFPLLWARVVET